MNAITLHHRVPRNDLGLGLVYVEGLLVEPAGSQISNDLEQWVICRREKGLSSVEEKFRQGSREILRNGRYRPTGRAKPASEYLIRAATEENFPHINGLVDANNLISLKYCVPISLWDLDLSGTDVFEVRLGMEGERYIFNPTGQVLELMDLICGCGLKETSVPLVTPVKDSMATKIQADTRRVVGCIYYPLAAGDREHLAQITAEFLAYLLTSGPQPHGVSKVVMPGETGVLSST